MKTFLREENAQPHQRLCQFQLHQWFCNNDRLSVDAFRSYLQTLHGGFYFVNRTYRARVKMVVECKDAARFIPLDFFFIEDHYQLQHVTFERNIFTVLLEEREEPQCGRSQLQRNFIDRYELDFPCLYSRVMLEETACSFL